MESHASIRGMDFSLQRLAKGAAGLGVGDVWFAIAVFSFLWLLYRLVLVYNKPTEDLEEILGIDIPPVPEVTLSSIASDSVLLYYKAPENYYSHLELSVQVNGVNGTFTRSDASIKVTRLRPAHFYGIRLVTTNNAGHPSYSSLIQVQTPPVEGHVGSKLLSSFEQTPSKRSGRRVSQPLSNAEKSHSPTGQGRSHSEQDDSQKKLQRTLDNLRRDVEEAEAQLKDDRNEAEGQSETLTLQRDALKRQVEEKEKESQELRKKVTELEKQCKASQRKKSERERKVQQKRAERQKMKDDLVRWEAEGIKIREDLEGTEQTKAEIQESHEAKLTQAEENIEKAQSEAAKLEEQLREMGIMVKKLEMERERADREQNDEETQAELREREEAEAHENKVHEYQHHYHALWKLNAEANARLQEVTEQLQHYLELRSREPGSFYPIPGLDYPMNSFPQARRTRARGSGMGMNRPGHPSYNHSANPSPTYSNSFPFIPAGASFGGNANNTSMDPDQFATGGPMSPSADILLPSDLLGDEDDSRLSSQRAAPPRRRNGSLGQVYQPLHREASKHSGDPNSPHSTDSKSPSLVSSPHNSFSNIHNIYARDQFGDDETQSLGSANSPFSVGPQATTPSSSRKISSLLWGFNRQRDKAPLSELPAFGSLKGRESQSFPSTLDSPEPPPSGGRKGTSIWSPMSAPFGFLNRGSGKQPDGDILTTTPRKTRRGLLGNKIDEPDVLAASSSRPSSTYSYDQLIGQSLVEGQVGWTTPDSSRPRGSTMERAGPWSHNQSRRTSIQHGSTSNLSIGSTPLEPSDDLTSPYNFGSKAPAPIGTERFRVGQRSLTPKLNPNAPTFSTRFFKKPKNEKSTEFGAEKTKSKDKDKEKEKEKDKEADKNREADTFSKSSSPPMSRLSHDAHSITTSASVGESHDSLEPTTSHSDTAGPTSGSAPKETLMQRITRKSSSSKFSVPWSKDRGNKGGSSRKEPSTPGDLEEDPDSDYLGRGSGTDTPQTDKQPGRGSLSWGRVMGRGKKRSELNMSDAGERSSEAGGETEDDG